MTTFHRKQKVAYVVSQDQVTKE